MGLSHFELTRLWKSTLAIRASDPYEAEREKLRAALAIFRERAESIGQQTARDMPDFTVHDLTHLDALWEMAERTAGEDYVLTPAEGFVLGGAFLIHDLGMCLAAYPEGRLALRSDQSWPDTVAALLRHKLGRTPSPEEVASPPADIETEAISETLRAVHARRAQVLAVTAWRDPNGHVSYHLIENPELRERYGIVIGQVAYSHWWAVPELKEKFTSKLGAPGGWPSEWTVDPLKLACLLRVADAAHIDSRRAPSFLGALRTPRGTAGNHWKFQEKLGTPEVRDERIFYTAGSPFTLEEAPAWWLCRDALETIDRELRQVDALLADTGRPRLVVRSVAGIDDPSRLTTFIPTEGWKPVDTRVRVTDIPALVARLGGKQLYGDEPTVPLRELIQNASDAVRARRLLEDRSEDWGQIIVRMGHDSNGHWLEVQDDGVGMSDAVLAGPLLDFGNTYWGSPLMRSESPGLLAKGFNPTGRYGIGFFSVFMWGQHVRVTTRRPEEAVRETRILEFSTGLTARPVLKRASETARLRDAGTTVRIWLKEDPRQGGGLLWRSFAEPWDLARLCEWLCPALDVNLSVEQEGVLKRVVNASDWLTMDGEALLRRLLAPSPNLLYRNPDPPDSRISVYAQRLRPLLSPGPVGRACVTADDLRQFDHIGVITVGGLRSMGSSSIGGILIGQATTAARNSATPIVDNGTLAAWASEQASLIATESTETERNKYEAAGTVHVCGGDTADLPIARGRSGWLRAKDITLPPTADECLLVHDAGVENLERNTQGPAIKLDANVLAVAQAHISLFHRAGWPQVNSLLSKVVVDAVAALWSAPEILISWRARSGDVQERRRVGTQRGRPISLSVDVLRRPRRAGKARRTRVVRGNKRRHHRTDPDAL